jgi:hypothetical protein
LLRFHTLVQDIVLQTLCNSGLGFLVLLMVRLFAIHPALPVAVAVSLLLALVGLLRISSGNGKDELALEPPSSLEEDPPTAAEPLSPAALSLTPLAPLTEQQPPLIPSSPPSEVETLPLATVEEGEPVGSGSGSDDETNQTSAKAGEEQCIWSDDDEEEAAEMDRRLEGSDSDESKDSDNSDGDWGDVQVVRVTRWCPLIEQ